MDPPSLKPSAYTDPHAAPYTAAGSQQLGMAPPPPYAASHPSPQHPGYQGQTSPPRYQKFDPKSKYQDVWAAVLFLLNLVGFTAVAVLSWPMLLERAKNPTPGNGVGGGKGVLTTTAPLSTTMSGAIAALASAGTALVLALVYLLLVQRFAGGMIRGTLVISVLLGFASAVFFLVLGQWIVGGISLLMALLYAVAAYMWRSRIPFAAQLLETVARVTQAYYGTVWIAFLGLLVQVVWSVVFAITAAAVMFRFNDDNGDPSCHVGPDGRRVCSNDVSTIAYVLTLYCVFCFFWTSQVIRNVVYVTVSGVFGTYFFLTNTTHLPQSGVTTGALKRACTTSFGSVCLGSLLIAVIQFLRYVAESLANNRDDDRSPVVAFLACIAACILACLQGLVEYFNRYAFAHVAIYGKPFIEAGRDTWRMIKDRGIDALINDDLIGNVFGCAALLVGMVNAAFGFLFLLILSPSSVGIGGGEVDWAVVAVVLVISFILGVAFMSIVSGVIDSGVATLFVCLAEDPDVLARQQPELFERIRQTWPRVVQPT